MQTVIKGDTKVYCIAAASIIAKVWKKWCCASSHMFVVGYSRSNDVAVSSDLPAVWI